jgi:hypothetical protein
MPIIETEIWKKNPERPGTVIFDSQRLAEDIFNELKAHLEADGRLPDEYFIFTDHLWGGGALFPKNAEILSSVAYGGSEGIYLDVSVRYRKEVSELNAVTRKVEKVMRTVTERFATGKTLGNGIEDLDRMNLAAASVTAAFHGDEREVRERYAKIKSGEVQAVYPIPQDNAAVRGEPDKTVETLFSVVQPGDWVIAAGNNDYRYLLGKVTAIDKLGSPEHETDNETDDVHVDFTAFDYPTARIVEIEERFALLTGKLKAFSQLPLDDVVMAPEMLISLSHLSADEREFMGNLRHNCEAFCNCFPGGVAAKSERHAELISRVEKNYSDYLDFLMGLDSRALIDMAGKIRATSDARLCLSTSHDFTDDEIDFYLKFQNPLSVVADAWYERVSDDSDMSIVLYDISYIQDALNEYPLVESADTPAEQLPETSETPEKSELSQDTKPRTLAEKMQAASEKVKAQDTLNSKTKSHKREERE